MKKVDQIEVKNNEGMSWEGRKERVLKPMDDLQSGNGR